MDATSRLWHDSLRQQSTNRDQGIAEELAGRFRSSPYLAIRGLTCDCHAGVAVVRGTVPNYHTRQIALTLARTVPGVTTLEDHIRVHR